VGYAEIFGRVVLVNDADVTTSDSLNDGGHLAFAIGTRSSKFKNTVFKCNHSLILVHVSSNI
jgi:hypothetical protein